MSKLFVILSVFMILVVLACGSNQNGEDKTGTEAKDSIEAKISENIDTTGMLLTRDSVQKYYETFILGQAPDINFFDLNRTSLKLSEYDEYLKLLVFWSTNSIPSRELLDTLAGVQRDMRDSGLIILALNADIISTEVLEEFADINRLPFPILYPQNRDAIAAYGVGVMPSAYLIDREMNIVAQFSGVISGEKIKHISNLFL